MSRKRRRALQVSMYCCSAAWGVATNSMFGGFVAALPALVVGALAIGVLFSKAGASWE